MTLVKIGSCYSVATVSASLAGTYIHMGINCLEHRSLFELVGDRNQPAYFFGQSLLAVTSSPVPASLCNLL